MTSTQPQVTVMDTTHPPSQEESSAVGSSIVSETNFDPIARKLVSVGSTEDLVSFNL